MAAVVEEAADAFVRSAGAEGRAGTALAAVAGRNAQPGARTGASGAPEATGACAVVAVRTGVSAMSVCTGGELLLLLFPLRAGCAGIDGAF
jgi:hypothetical protein